MQIPFPITTFQDPSGNPISYGLLQIRLNEDAKSPVGEIYAAMWTSIPLDINGKIEGSPLFWQVTDLQPSGAIYYVYRVFSSVGQLVAGPDKEVF